MPTEAPTPTPTPTPTPVAERCDEPLVTVEPEQVLPAEVVELHIDRFPPDADIAILIAVAEATPRQFGVSVTDAQGSADMTFRLPKVLPFGPATVTVATLDGVCSSDVSMEIVASHEVIAIDDETVVPGQRVIVTAGGFQPGGPVTLVLDGDAFDLLGTGRPLRTVRADQSGTARIRVVIPRGISAGRHLLTANGYSFNGENDLIVSVNITVVLGTVPPTDTEPGG